MDARQRLNQKRKQGGSTTTRGGKVGRGKGRGGGAVSRASARLGQVKGNNVRAGKTSATKAGITTKRPGRTITVTRSVRDLRQLIGTPSAAKKVKAGGTVAKQTAVKKRLGLQSKAAREAAKGFRSDAVGRTATRATDNVPRVTISNPSTRGGGARRIASRAAGIAAGQPLSKSKVWRRSDIQPQYVFPQTQPPTVIIATQPFGGGGDLRGNAQGNQIVVSNLNHTITQSDILELFGDIGTIASYTMVNPSTAMISYVDPANASEAVQNYHNRLLDGLPMQCTLIPSPSLGGGSGSSSASGTNRHVAQAFQQALRNTR